MISWKQIALDLMEKNLKTLPQLQKVTWWVPWLLSIWYLTVLFFQIVLLLMLRFSIWNQGRSWDGIAKIFVPGTWVPKPKIPGLLTKSLGFGCPKEFCPCTVSAIFVLVQGVPGICVSWDPSPVDLSCLKYANSRSKLWIMQELFSKTSF